jgi:hypothetical protein
MDFAVVSELFYTPFYFKDAGKRNVAEMEAKKRVKYANAGFGPSAIFFPSVGSTSGAWGEGAMEAMPGFGKNRPILKTGRFFAGFRGRRSVGHLRSILSFRHEVGRFFDVPISGRSVFAEPCTRVSIFNVLQKVCKN